MKHTRLYSTGDLPFPSEWVALKRAFWGLASTTALLGAGVLGDSLGALRHGVLGQLTGEQEAHGSLDLPGGDG
uniref:Uncharacterized protein n=1 Tax=Paramormyrops kingsleyae TaxID=1676925 RepID=A0A3B3T6W0_9TELE